MEKVKSQPQIRFFFREFLQTLRLLLALTLSCL